MNSWLTLADLDSIDFKKDLSNQGNEKSENWFNFSGVVSGVVSRFKKLISQKIDKSEPSLDEAPIVLPNIWEFNWTTEFERFLSSKVEPSSQELKHIKNIKDFDVLNDRSLLVDDVLIKCDMILLTIDSAKWISPEVFKKISRFISDKRLFITDRNWRSLSKELNMEVFKWKISRNSKYIYLFIAKYKEYLLNYKQRLEESIKNDKKVFVRDLKNKTNPWEDEKDYVEVFDYDKSRLWVLRIGNAVNNLKWILDKVKSWTIWVREVLLDLFSDKNNKIKVFANYNWWRKTARTLYRLISFWKLEANNQYIINFLTWYINYLQKFKKIVNKKLKSLDETSWIFSFFSSWDK